MPCTVHKLNKAKRKKNDEYYTKREHVEHIFNDILDKTYFKDKIIYLPCDGEQSNFTIYLKEKKDEIKYKELIYTSDDFNTHLDLFEKCDIVITNPPFSKLMKEFIPILCKVKKDFFIFGSLGTLPHYYRLFNNANIEIKFLRDRSKDNKPLWFNFNTPDEIDPMPVQYVYVTNIHNINVLYPSPKLSDEDKFTCYAHVWNDEHDFGRIKVYDSVIDIPKDINENFLCPLTILHEHNKRLFNMKRFETHFKLEYEDKKPRYVRVFVIMK